MSEPHDPPSADAASPAADALDAGLAAGFAAAPNDTRSFRPIAEAVGAVIAGKYKLLEKIGEGGMGTVWAAEQTTPVKRKVALKLIKAGMDSGSVLARFEAERQALALMDHPNIAKVLDGGLTEAGRPFFVMEYVKGVPISECCDATRLSIDERLNLFVQVCAAVQHAHQKGIIHRDLKPSNILVAPYDDKPVPKVIDFGLAKAMYQPLTDRTLHTAHETVLGTPAYMSPEQAQLNNIDVDTRTDIYSLGVVLYELLTGTTPLERQRFKQAAWEEMRRIIREEEPPRPSARLSSSATLASLAACRRSEPRALTKQLRGELDWVVMKALEKDRTRRYETANGLSRDVQRYLADEIVEARPPSRGYRLKKFVRRHKRQVIAASAVLFVLLAGIAGTTYGLVQADQNRQEAETNLGYARKTNKVLESVFASLDPKANYATLADLRNALRDSLKKAVNELDESEIGDPLAVADIQHTLGRSLHGLGEHEAAIAVLEQAVAARTAHLGRDHPDTLTSMSYLGDAYSAVDKYDRAVPIYAETLRLRKATLGADHADTLISMDDLGCGYMHAGKLSEGLPLLEEAQKKQIARFGQEHFDSLRMTNNLAMAYLRAKKVAWALPLFEETLEIEKKVHSISHPHTIVSMGNLATALQAAGKPEQAVPLFEKAVELAKDGLGHDHPGTLGAMRVLGLGLLEAGKIDQAVAVFAEEWRLEKTRFGRDHRTTLLTMGHLAIAYRDAGNVKEGLSLLEQALKLHTARDGPNHSITLQCMNALAQTYERAGDLQRALSIFEGTLEQQKKTLGLAHIDTLRTMNNLAMAHWKAGHLNQAVPLLEEILDGQKELLGVHDRDTLTTMNNLAGAYQYQGNMNRAVQVYEQTLKLLKEKYEPNHPDTLRCMNNLAMAYKADNRFDLAVPLLEDTLKGLIAGSGTNHPNTLMTMHNLADAYAETNQREKAIETLTIYATEVRKRYPKGDPQLAAGLCTAAASFLQCGQYDTAETLVREGLDIREKIAPDAWTTFNARSVLGGALLGRKKYADAEPLLRSGYLGMKQREKTIPPSGTTCIPRALDRLIEMCTATNRPDEAKQWQAVRAKYPKRTPPSDKK